VLGLRGKRLFQGPVLPAATWFGLLATIAAHAVFFGAGRYSMVVFPLVTAFAFCQGRPSAAPETVGVTPSLSEERP
jgi:hypothetical protein